MSTQVPFWKRKGLDEMTVDEWESLCDGCARCCLIKLQDIETDEIQHTRVVCRFLEQDRCRCTVYPRRHELVSDCLRLTPESLRTFDWLPETCGYRRVAEGKDLEWWHPLMSGSRETVHEAEVSIRGWVISEDHVHPDGLEEHVIDTAVPASKAP